MFQEYVSFNKVYSVTISSTLLGNKEKDVIVENRGSFGGNRLIGKQIWLDPGPGGTQL